MEKARARSAGSFPRGSGFWFQYFHISFVPCGYAEAVKNAHEFDYVSTYRRASVAARHRGLEDDPDGRSLDHGSDCCLGSTPAVVLLHYKAHEHSERCGMALLEGSDAHRTEVKTQN